MWLTKCSQSEHVYCNINIACFEASDWTLHFLNTFLNAGCYTPGSVELPPIISQLPVTLTWGTIWRAWVKQVVPGSLVTPWFSWGRRSCQWPPRLAEGSQGSFRQPSCSQLWPLRPSTRRGEGQQQLLVLTRRKCSCCQAAFTGVRLAEMWVPSNLKMETDSTHFLLTMSGEWPVCVLKSITSYIQFQVVFWAPAGQPSALSHNV